ncbi:aminotransferase class IV [Alkaliphilus serpentinus]|uniref:Aminotransferase IV n=1 Tax=Alkaliphilus serpentinus TaxID=1482731 RepID=A0A833HLR8_9FIRM|nr:aminotransferase class IV [Alkaliphilus serpentinus]KAB3526628.1 aminotransferase IV [Alkaliphilus serpentinus]
MYIMSQKKFFISNGQLKNLEDFDESLIDIYPSVYEVIRVLSGVPLFVEEHIDRLQNSLRLLNNHYEINACKLLEDINRLIENNGFPDENIKIIINQLNKSKPDTYIFFIPSSYPSQKEYNFGVATILFPAERHNPNAKVVAKEQRELISLTLKEKGAYEALLVNNEGYITEGSRSNVFFVKDEIVYTPPADQVLEGITRKRVITLCKDLGIVIIEKSFSSNTVHKMDAVFMTGTSPKVLPITVIDDRIFDSPKNPIVLKIMKAYNNLIDEYIRKNRP